MSAPHLHIHIRKYTGGYLVSSSGYTDTSDEPRAAPKIRDAVAVPLSGVREIVDKIVGEWGAEIEEPETD